MKTILVTGSTGFLGKHLLERLRRNEPAARLRLLCRSASAFEPDAQTEIIHGDITSAEDVSRAMEGVDEVYHLAGIVEREAQDLWRQYRTHVEGTRNVCEAVRRHRIGRAVVVSSSGTIAVSREPIVHDENSGYAVETVAEWPYYLSKIYAEKLAFWYVEHCKLPLVVVNPSLLLGPGDERESSTRDVARFLEGQILVVPSGGVNIVDVRDAAAGLTAAMKHGRIGERYLLGGPNWTFREWIERVARISGRRPPRIELPLGAALLGARVARRVYSMLGKEFRLDDASVKMSALFWYCDSSKARAELGFTARDPMETLRETVDDLCRRNPRLRA